MSVEPDSFQKTAISVEHISLIYGHSQQLISSTDAESAYLPSVYRSQWIRTNAARKLITCSIRSHPRRLACCCGCRQVDQRLDATRTNTHDDDPAWPLERRAAPQGNYWISPINRARQPTSLPTAMNHGGWPGYRRLWDDSRSPSDDCTFIRTIGSGFYPYIWWTQLAPSEKWGEA